MKVFSNRRVCLRLSALRPNSKRLSADLTEGSSSSEDDDDHTTWKISSCRERENHFWILAWHALPAKSAARALWMCVCAQRLPRTPKGTNEEFKINCSCSSRCFNFGALARFLDNPPDLFSNHPKTSRLVQKNSFRSKTNSYGSREAQLGDVERVEALQASRTKTNSRVICDLGPPNVFHSGRRR